MVDTDSTVGAARESAAHVKDEAAREGAHVKDSVTEHAGQVADQVQQQARTVFAEARSGVEHEVDNQGRRIGEMLQQTSDQLRSMAGATEPGLLTDVTRQLADAAARTGGRMQERGLQAVADDLRRFARRQPGVFLLGAGVAGFVAARLVRAGVSGTTNGASSPASARPVTSSVGALPAPMPPVTPSVPAGAAGGGAGSSSPPVAPGSVGARS
jgi:hypothetical protein